MASVRMALVPEGFRERMFNRKRAHRAQRESGCVMGWQIGGSPKREAGIVCFNEKCGERDKVTNRCPLKISANRCRDRIGEKALDRRH